MCLEAENVSFSSESKLAQLQKYGLKNVTVSLATQFHQKCPWFYFET